MSLTLRSARPEDAARCGQICFEAFTAISNAHNFPPDFPAPDFAIGLMNAIIARPDVFSVVAEVDGRIVGSNFLWESNAHVAGVGPITVDPTAQNASVGRRMMERVLQRAAERGLPGVRLVQAAYHGRSLSLYAKLGFNITEPLACIQGRPESAARIPGRSLRAATLGDLDPCNALCRFVHGHDRAGDLRDGIAHGQAMVVEHGGRITGYCTGIGFFSHAVAEANDDLQALIGGAKQIAGPGLLLPMRNTDLLRWCLHSGLRITQPMTLMALGLYNEPRGAWLPSILY